MIRDTIHRIMAEMEDSIMLKRHFVSIGGSLQRLTELFSLDLVDEEKSFDDLLERLNKILVSLEKQVHRIREKPLLVICLWSKTFSNLQATSEEINSNIETFCRLRGISSNNFKFSVDENIFSQEFQRELTDFMKDITQSAPPSLVSLLQKEEINQPIALLNEFITQVNGLIVSELPESKSELEIEDTEDRDDLINLLAFPPSYFLCPFTQQLMNEPILILETGLSYEKSSLLHHLTENNDQYFISDITKADKQTDYERLFCVSNKQLKLKIETWKQQREINNNSGVWKPKPLDLIQVTSFNTLSKEEIQDEFSQEEGNEIELTSSIRKHFQNHFLQHQNSHNQPSLMNWDLLLEKARGIIFLSMDQWKVLWNNCNNKEKSSSKWYCYSKYGADCEKTMLLVYGNDYSQFFLCIPDFHEESIVKILSLATFMHLLIAKEREKEDIRDNFHSNIPYFHFPGKDKTFLPITEYSEIILYSGLEKAESLMNCLNGKQMKLVGNDCFLVGKWLKIPQSRQIPYERIIKDNIFYCGPEWDTVLTQRKDNDISTIHFQWELSFQFQTDSKNTNINNSGTSSSIIAPGSPSIASASPTKSLYKKSLFQSSGSESFLSKNKMQSLSVLLPTIFAGFYVRQCLMGPVLPPVERFDCSLRFYTLEENYQLIQSSILSTWKTKNILGYCMHLLPEIIEYITLDILDRENLDLMNVSMENFQSLLVKNNPSPEVLQNLHQGLQADSIAKAVYENLIQEEYPVVSNCWISRLQLEKDHHFISSNQQSDLQHACSQLVLAASKLPVNSPGKRKNKIIINYSEVDLQVKHLLVGDSGVGKTCLLSRLSTNTFNQNYNPSIGIDLKVVHDFLYGKKVKQHFWDTAGHERFRRITTSYFRKTMSIYLIYDVTKRKSFESIKEWYVEVTISCQPNVVVTLIGNKNDLNESRQVSFEEGLELAKDLGCPFFEASAKDNVNVALAFHVATNLLLLKAFDFKDGSVEDAVNILSQGDADVKESMKESIVVIRREMKKKRSWCILL
jgi:Ras-related protein Rab-8A